MGEDKAIPYQEKKRLFDQKINLKLGKFYFFAEG